jgi:hypothetical protein
VDTDVLNTLITSVTTIVGAIIGAAGVILAAKIRSRETEEEPSITNKGDQKPAAEPAKKKISLPMLSIGAVPGLLIGLLIGLGITRLTVNTSSGEPMAGDETLTPAVVTPVPTTVMPPTATPWPFTDGFPFDPETLCTITYLSSETDNTNVVKIEFNLEPEEGYCGWGIRLHDYDASTKTTLIFWVRGEKGGEMFKVGIKDSFTPNGQEPKVEKTASNTQWQQISIPLEKFEGQKLRSLDNLSLSFEYGLQASGVIYVKDFSFD